MINLISTLIFSVFLSSAFAAELFPAAPMKITTDKPVTLAPAKQILIKAHIVNIDRNYTQSLGFIFNTTNPTVQSSKGFTLNLPSFGTESAIAFPIAKLGEGILLEATLTALEQEGHAESISDPQLLTVDGQSATLESGQEVPYQQTSENGGTTIAFKKAVLSLKVTPHLKPNNKVLLDLLINQDQVSSLTVNGVPAIKTQQLQTQVLMKNQNTLVLGGLFEENTSIDQQRVPFLSKIPIIGYLFRHQENKNERKQLLIFVTPIIASI